MLTPRQKQLFDFLVLYIGEHGFAPSFHEMRVAVGLKSKSGVHRLLTGIEKRGYIRRRSGVSRAIEINELPGHFCPKCGYHLHERQAA